MTTLRISARNSAANADAHYPLFELFTETNPKKCTKKWLQYRVYSYKIAVDLILNAALAVDSRNMKRCPECRRDYFDDTLSFCLDDGARLLEGPGSDESATAVLPAVKLPDEAPTKEFDADQNASSKNTNNEQKKDVYPNNKKFLLIGLAVVLIPAVFLGYRLLPFTESKQIESIAVMPFVNESGNADVDYLSDGMTETLINTLTQQPNLKVKPRSSAFRYKDRESDAKTIGSELNVAAILNGRLVQRGEDITLFLSLIDTKTEDQLWGKQYTRKLANLVTLQTEIVRDVSESLKSKFTGADEAKLAKSDTANPEAYRLYLQGRFFWNKRRIGDMGKAIGFFQQAIELDPNYARAHAGLADAVAQPNDIVPHLQRAEKARAAALKALSLDNDLAEAHSALSHILARYDLDFAGAERELERAIALDPKWPDTYQRYGDLYTFLGRYDEGLAKLRQGLDIEPFNLPLNTSYGGALLYARRYDEAVTQLEKALELDPNHRNAHLALSMAYSLKGRYAEAVEHRVAALKLAKQDQWADGIREGFMKDGWPGVVRAELERFRLVDRSADRLPYYNEAHLLAALGKKEMAFAALEKSLESREQPALVFLKTDPRFDPLRSDPRFAELVKKLGFPE